MLQFIPLWNHDLPLYNYVTWASSQFKSSAHRLFVEQLVLACNKEKIKSTHCWSCIWFWLSVESLRMRAVMQKTFPWYNVFMFSIMRLHFIWQFIIFPVLMELPRCVIWVYQCGIYFISETVYVAHIRPFGWNTVRSGFKMLFANILQICFSGTEVIICLSFSVPVK